MTMTDYQFLAWEVNEGIGQITLNRPPLNILHLALLRELRAVLEQAAQATTLRVLVLRATGKLFSAGVEVADHTPDKVGEMIPLFDAVCRALADFPAPTLAVVHGHALGGGCELALCCDLIVASETANLGQPEIKLATIAPIAALTLPGVIGYRRAAELLFTGEPLGASEAARAGLINRAVPAGELAATVEGYLSQFNKLSAPALRVCKQALRLSAVAWSQLPAIEKLYLDELMATSDAREGVQAFMDKRAPQWRHQ